MGAVEWSGIRKAASVFSLPFYFAVLSLPRAFFIPSRPILLLLSSHFRFLSSNDGLVWFGYRDRPVTALSALNNRHCSSEIASHYLLPARFLAGHLLNPSPPSTLSLPMFQMEVE